MRLPATFQERRVTLSPDIPSDLVWSANEFSAHTGNAELSRPVSVQFDIFNEGAYAIGISMSYETRTESVPLLEEKENRSVPPNTRLLISSVNLPTLANIRPRANKITARLISLGNVSALVRLRLDEAQEASGQGAGSGFSTGLEAGQYEPVFVREFFVNSVASTGGTLYTVPSGRRCFVDLLRASTTATPIQYWNLQSEISYSTGGILVVARSDITQNIENVLTPQNLILEETTQINYEFSSGKPNSGAFGEVALIGREVIL